MAVTKIKPIKSTLKKEFLFYEEYDVETAEDIQYALADLLGGTIKGLMEAEMNEHLGYQER